MGRIEKGRCGEYHSRRTGKLRSEDEADEDGKGRRRGKDSNQRFQFKIRQRNFSPDEINNRMDWGKRRGGL